MELSQRIYELMKFLMQGFLIFQKSSHLCPVRVFLWLVTVTYRNFSYLLRKYRKIMKDFFEIFHPSIMGLVEMKRFELLTPCVQGRCSPN